MKSFALLAFLLFMTHASLSQKTHSVTFGRWTTVRLSAGDDESKIMQERVRALLIDGHAKEMTFGPVHDVTERTFVVQRIYRLNDSLPQEIGPPRWLWERGAWLLVNRVSGRVQMITLPEFDPDISTVSWFRDYAAYCGVSDDGKKTFAIVAQPGKRKPVLKKELSTATDCASPLWQRNPARVTFEPVGDAKFSYEIKSHAVDLVSDDDDDSGEQ